MKTKVMTVEYPDDINVPEYFFQKFDYKNNNPACTQQDVDYCIIKNNKAVLIESKTWGAYLNLKPAQRSAMQILADNANKVYVVAVHDSPYVEDNISLVQDAYNNQRVVEYWYNGSWIKVDDHISLKDFINKWFRTVWNLTDDIVK